MTTTAPTEQEIADALQVTCRSCKRLPDEQCWTLLRHTVLAKPHIPRLDAGAGWRARQGEVDNALHDLDAAVDQVGVLTDQVRDIQRALFIAEDEKATVTADLATALTRARILEATHLLDLKRIAELEAQLEPEPEPEPERPALTFGIGVDQIPTGIKPQYHRTYWTLPATGVHTKAVAQAKTDLANGATPVMSFKLPVSWQQAAAGAADGPAKATADALEALGGVVVVAFHHEPEDDGTLADFKAMSTHLASVVKRPTVQFWVCFMGYHQLYGDSTWKLADVLVPGVDGYGFDPYLSFGASSTKWTDQTASYYAKFGAWAKANGVQWGIWETGINEQAITSAAPAATWFADCATGAEANGAAMWIYFNSETTLDGKHNWKLTTTGANKLAQFTAAVAKYAR